MLTQVFIPVKCSRCGMTYNALILAEKMRSCCPGCGGPLGEEIEQALQKGCSIELTPPNLVMGDIVWSSELYDDYYYINVVCPSCGAPFNFRIEEYGGKTAARCCCGNSAFVLNISWGSDARSDAVSGLNQDTCAVLKACYVEDTGLYLGVAWFPQE